MADVQVTCITKPDRLNRHESITHLGGRTWTWTKEQVIASINLGTNSFYTLVGGRRAQVRVVEESGKQPYLRTVADGYWSNDLLALTECAI